MKWFIILMIFLIMGSLLNQPSDKYNRPQFVKIEVTSEYGDWSGSGVFVIDNVVLTAGHVVDDAISIVIIYPDGTSVEATEWFEQDEDIADLGIVVVNTRKIEPGVVFADATVEQEVILCGAPFGIYPIVTKGIVSAVDIQFEDGMFSECPVIIIDAASNGGNSGGPAFDNKNRIIGILVGGYNYSQGMNIVVPADQCKAFLEDVLWKIW